MTGMPVRGRFLAAVIGACVIATAPPPAQASILDHPGTAMMVVIGGGIVISMAALTQQTMRCHGQPQYATQCVNDLRSGLYKHRLLGPAVVLGVINQMVAAGVASLATGKTVAADVGLNPDAVLIGSRHDMKPPGNCTPNEHRSLADQKDRTCNVPRACTNRTDPQTAARNAAQTMACIQIRQQIMHRCFMGGNQAHQDHIDRVDKIALAKCQARMVVP